jgi:hypothetical protein
MNSHPRHLLLLPLLLLAHSVRPRLERSRQNSPRSNTPSRLDLRNNRLLQLSITRQPKSHTKHYSHSPKRLSDSFSLPTLTPPTLFRLNTREKQLRLGLKPPFLRMLRPTMDSVMRLLLRLEIWERMMIKPFGRLGGLYSSFLYFSFSRFLRLDKRIEIYEISCIVYD